MNNHKNWAFSLLEVIVVIAILAIISAVGAQQYQQYKVRAKLTNDYMSPINNLMEQSKTFANTHGRFPTATELGFTPDTTITSTNQVIIGIGDGGGSPAGTPIVSVPGTAYLQIIHVYGANDPCKFVQFYALFDRKGPINDSYVSSFIYYVVDTGSTYATYCFADETDATGTTGLDNGAITGCPSIYGSLYNTMVNANFGDICSNFQ